MPALAALMPASILPKVYRGWFNETSARKNMPLKANSTSGAPVLMQFSLRNCSSDMLSGFSRPTGT